MGAVSPRQRLVGWNGAAYLRPGRSLTVSTLGLLIAVAGAVLVLFLLIMQLKLHAFVACC